MPDISFKLILVADDANVKHAEVMQKAQSAQSVVEKPVSVKITAEQALAAIRDVNISVVGVVPVVSDLVRSINRLLDASLGQRQSYLVASKAFGKAATERSVFNWSS